MGVRKNRSFFFPRKNRSLFSDAHAGNVLSSVTQARARDAVYFKSTKYVKGTPEKAVITEVIPAEISK